MKLLGKILFFGLLMCFTPAVLIAQGSEGRCVSGNCTDGFGKYEYSTPAGMVYEGNFSNGKRHGEGTIKNADGSGYTGDFKDGFMHGKGVFTFANGDRYAGEMANDRIQGIGTATFQSGEKLTGTWADNWIVNGSGTVYDGQNIYRGQVVNGKYEGEGIYTYATGKKFTGTFRDGLPLTGKGYIYFNADSIAYEGDVKDGLLSGQGTITYQNGNSYTGAFANNEINGDGVFTAAGGDTYSGNFVKGELEGQGSYVSTGGTSYKGNFKASKFNGYGEATYKDGIYKGNWVNNQREGEGTFYDLNMKIIQAGTWSNNVVVQQSSSSSGNSYYNNEEVDGDWTTAKDIFHRHNFSGTQQQTLDGYEGSGVDISASLYISSDYSISGTFTTTIGIEGYKYSSTSEVTGRYTPADFKIHLDFGRVTSFDPLPDGLYWIDGGYSNGNIFTDSEHNGYYIIEGKNNEGWSFQMSDY